MGCTPGHRGFSLAWGSALYDPGPRPDLRHRCHTPTSRHGHPRQAYRTGFTLAEWLCRAVDRINPARVLGPRYCFGRGTSAPDSKIIRRLLQHCQNASVFAQGCAYFPPDSSDRNHSFTPDPRRASPSLRPGLSFRYTHPADSLKFPATMAQPVMPICRATGCPGRSHSASFDHRRRPEMLRTAMAMAFFWPTSTTSRFPRVTPV